LNLRNVSIRGSFKLSIGFEIYNRPTGEVRRLLSEGEVDNPFSKSAIINLEQHRYLATKSSAYGDRGRPSQQWVRKGARRRRNGRIDLFLRCSDDLSLC
jgi:hypothetical protein